MTEEKKKAGEIIESNIESGLEEISHGVKKNLKVICSIKFKNFKARAGKIYLKFPVEKATDEKASLGEIFKGGKEIELRNVCLKECGLIIDIPQLVQEIISSKGKQ